MPFTLTGWSDYAESGILNHIFRTSTLTKPTTLAIALCPNVPDEADASGLIVGHEITNAGGYARQVLAPLDANWTFSYTNGSGTITNASTITFPVATADWGWISGVALMDNSGWGSGNLITGGALATPKLIGNGDQFKQNAGDFAFYMS